MVRHHGNHSSWQAWVERQPPVEIHPSACVVKIHSANIKNVRFAQHEAEYIQAQVGTLFARTKVIFDERDKCLPDQLYRCLANFIAKVRSDQVEDTLLMFCLAQ
jgi:hypothetical protein